ncbi:MAG TPA: DUF6470 family protein [Bacillales bacterium]|nr:DUF6470 family protein [Bacillales bacterium]
MNTLQLQMQSTFGRIGLQTRVAKLNIRQSPADLRIRQPKAEMRIEHRSGKLDIDQSQAFAEANLKSVFAWGREYAKRGHQAVLEGIARRAAEGDRLMKIENGGNPIAAIAAENSAPPPARINIGWMPKSPFSVKFHYSPAELNIHWQTFGAEIQAKPHPPEFSFVRGDVNVYMRVWPSLTIDVSGSRIDHHI